VPGPERFRPRYGGRFSIAIVAVVSPGAACGSARDTTSTTGRTGGPTTLSNLTLLCRRHHRAVHEEGFGVTRRPDGAIEFSLPDGRPLPATPAPAATADDPEASVRAQNEMRGVQIHPRTAMPSWPGDRLDLGYAVDVLRPKRKD